MNDRFLTQTTGDLQFTFLYERRQGQKGLEEEHHISLWVYAKYERPIRYLSAFAKSAAGCMFLVIRREFWAEDRNLGIINTLVKPVESNV